MKRVARASALAVALVVATGSAAWAHKPSDAHLQIAVSGAQLSGTLAVALRDLDGALDLDGDGDGAITWAEARSAEPRIAAYIRERLSVGDPAAPCPLVLGSGKLVDFSDGAYWAVPLASECPAAPDELIVRYALLFDVDALHRGIVQIQTARAAQTMVARDATPIAVALGNASTLALVQLGARRVWTSWASLAVLACLVSLSSPSWRRRPIATIAMPRPIPPTRRFRRLRPIALPRSLTTLPRVAWVLGRILGSAGRAVRDIGAVFGSFALASAATLLLSATGLLYVPGEIVEPAVALAAVLAALASLMRTSWTSRALSGRRNLAFELGLIHGLACAVWLGDAAAAPYRLVSTLGFAAGIAAAEASLVGLATAILLALRPTGGR